MTAPINGTTPTFGTTPGTSSSSPTGMTSLLQPNTFLTLLVDEMKYQDPLNPTSSSSFMAQLAQLSQVEQLSSVSSSLEISQAAALIGKSVTGYDTSGKTVTGTVTGVTTGTNGPVLDVGGSFVQLSSVTKIGS